MSPDQAVERVVSTGDFLLGVDFDGTLAPIVDHPDDAVPDRRALDLLRTVAGLEGADVAVVSGRALADLTVRLGEVPGATLVGEHGNDVGDPNMRDPVIAEAETMIDELAEEAGGATVERKRNSVTFHYRGMDDLTADDYVARIRRWAREHGVTMLEGKKVIELTAGTRTKADAIRDLARGRPVIYIGDDVTDETVFESLGAQDVGVKVGEGPTAASHQVEDIAGVVRILEAIALASR